MGVSVWIVEREDQRPGGVSDQVDHTQGDIADGDGPADYLIALGCSQWSPGQLEEELEANAWISIEPDHDLIYVSENEPAWKQAIAKLGIDPGQLASIGGHA